MPSNPKALIASNSRDEGNISTLFTVFILEEEEDNDDVLVLLLPRFPFVEEVDEFGFKVDDDDEDEEVEKDRLAAATNPARNAFLDTTVRGLLLLSKTTPRGLIEEEEGDMASVRAFA